VWFLICIIHIIRTLQENAQNPQSGGRDWRRTEEERTYLSQAKFAQAYILAISSSCFRLLHLFRDCAKSEPASSMSSAGRAPVWRGMRFASACSIGRLMFGRIEVRLQVVE